MKTLLFRIGILLLGIPLFPKMVFAVAEQLSAKIRDRALWRKDGIIALALFCVADLFGTIYVYFIQATNQLGLFYKSTTIAPPELKIFLGIFNPYGVLFGIVIVVFYAICRQGMGRALSVFCALMFMVSANHLHNLVPSILRDYARVPSILSILLIMIVLAVSPFNENRLIALSSLAGIIVGFSLRVREDMLLLVFPFVLLLLCFLPGHLLSNLKIKIAACILFVMFALAFMPASVQPSARNAVRVLGGSSSSFDTRMGITNSVYDWGYQYSDEFPGDLPYAQASVINPKAYGSSTPKEFDRAGSEYLTRVFCLVPADMVARAYATVVNIIELPFIYTEPPRGLSNPLVNVFYVVRARLLDRLSGYGIVFVALSLIIISFKSLREALFCLFLILFFAGYPSLEFQGRHYFHLEIVGWWCFGFVVQRLFNAKLLIQDSLKNWRNYLKQSLVFIFVALIVILSPLYVFRQYQAWRLTEIIKKCDDLSLVRLPVVWEPLATGLVLITDPAKFKPAKKGTMAGDYLVAEFDTRNSSFSTLWPIISYERVPFLGKVEFSRTITLNTSKEITRLFFPVIYDHMNDYSITFKGLKMSREQAACFRGLYRVQNPSILPILLTIKYPILKRDEALHRKINRWEYPAIQTVPVNLSSNRLKYILSQQIIPINDKSLIYRDSNMLMISGRWLFKGYAKEQKDPYDHPLLYRKYSTISNTLFAYPSLGLVDTDLMRTKDVWLKKGSCFVARGELRTGGLTFGLIRNGQGSGYVSLADRGPFTVVIEVPVDGYYSVGMANYLDVYTSLENRFVINTMGWVKLR